ncbi:MAG: long-chain fatty acid--CoA ligase [Planctomycetota bacterium]
MDPIYAAFRRVAGEHGGRSALMSRHDGEFTPITFEALAEKVRTAAAALKQAGIEPGDRVGIFSYNRPEWAIADLAVHAIGGIVVPLYHTLTEDTVAYILRDSGMKLLFVENDELLRIVTAARDQTPELGRIVAFDPVADDDVAQWPDFLGDVGEAEDPAPATTTDDVATIVYTSGTTGEPKGVMLTHGNIMFNVEVLREQYEVTPDDVYVSYLPLAHIFERTCGYYLVLLSGATIAYAQSVTTVVEDIQAVEPTVLAAVPRAIEKAYDTVVRRVEEGSGFQQWLVRSTVRCLNEFANRQYRGLRIPLLLRGRCVVLNSLVASKFRRIAGRRLRLIVSGGAPLDRRLAKILNILGFLVLEGYGLTETSPSVTAMTMDDVALGTVGTPIPGVEVKIGDGDEILVRGPNVMKGYYGKPEATAEAIDEDGFFHTGDRGRFDGKGRLVITGRIKDLIVTSYGKNVAPSPIEEDLMRKPIVSMAMLTGDNRKHISALLVPDPDIVLGLASREGVPPAPDDPNALLEDERIRREFEDVIEKANAKLANYEKIRRYCFLPEAPSVENGLLTPTLKLRRNVVAERYAEQIEDMYRQPEAPAPGRDT